MFQMPGDFSGETIRSRTVSGLALRESRYPPGLNLGVHAHARGYFCLVLQGSYEETQGGRVRTCPPSTLTFQRPGEAHANRFHGRGARLFSIELEAPWAERLRESRLEYSAHFPGGPLGPLALRLYGEFRRRDEASALAIEGLALELLAAVWRHAGRGAGPAPLRPVQRARDYLHAAFAEPIRLTAVAESVGVHPACLARAFRREYGSTVGEYVRQLRVEFASRQIANTDESLVSIALAAGFADQAHFCRAFKRLTGLTPSEYRSAVRANPGQKFRPCKTRP
jgi:AraC family transcriptional regulator